MKEKAASTEPYKNLFALQNKVAIVTGGNGHLGTSITKALASFGATVFVFSRNDYSFQALSDFHENIHFVKCDVTDEKHFRHEVATLQKSFSNIDILVNNAFNERRKQIEDITKSEWNVGIENILSQVFFCTQAVLPGMLKAGHGAIVNIGSIYGFLGHNQDAYQEVKSSSIFYSVAKGGVIQMTRRLATEYASKGIRVNCISPGNFPKKTKGSPDRPGYIVALSEKTPMKRVGHPDEICGAVVYLSSQASSYVTGQNLIVDGGWSAW